MIPSASQHYSYSCSCSSFVPNVDQNNFEPRLPFQDGLSHYHNNIPVNLQYSQSYCDYPQYYFQYPYSTGTMDTSTQDEMEQFQRLSDQYQADLPGPMVGERLPMSNLVEEYTAADPTFVVKTQTLAATHSGYRRVKGDGQCGWRGTVFGYFETLLQLKDIQRIQLEEVRLQSYADTMRMAGIDYDIMVDMFDYTWELFTDLKKAVEQQSTDELMLLQHFNDEHRSNSIVYHFKMMTSAFLQNNPDNYEPFLEMPLGDYRALRIDPPNQEIDQVGLQILTDGVIAQAGFAVDVLYLDRSIGDEVTPHEFAPQHAGEPTIRLLYRPGHYDIIYKDNPASHGTTTYSTMVDQSIPLGQGYTGDVGYQGQHIQSQTSIPTPDAFTYSPSNPQTRQAYMFEGQSILPVSNSQHITIMSDGNSTYSTQPFPQTPPTFQTPSTPTSLPSSRKSSESDNEPKFRIVNSQFKYNSRKHSCIPLCAPAFGSAAWQSTANFRNRQFQPLVWNAGVEYGRG